MKLTEIIEAIRQKLTVPGGRHLYGVLGTYRQLEGFAKKLHQATTTDGDPFPKPVNVNRGILDAIPDDEFKQLAENEAKRPEPTAAHVAKAFERFLRANLTGKGNPGVVQPGDALCLSHRAEPITNHGGGRGPGAASLARPEVARSDYHVS